MVLAHLAETWLSLPTTATLLPVRTLLSLRVQRILVLPVPSYFVGLRLATLLTESPAGFRDIHQVCQSAIGTERKKDADFKLFVKKHDSEGSFDSCPPPFLPKRFRERNLLQEEESKMSP